MVCFSFAYAREREKHAVLSMEWKEGPGQTLTLFTPKKLTFTTLGM
jgi:hypothetical protein